MEQPSETQPSSRTRRRERNNDSSTTRSDPPSYGYHNTFHTHATPVLDTPPSYARATSPQTLAWLNTKAQAEAEARRKTKAPPAYSCTVEMEGILGLRNELTSVFEISRSREWNDVYVKLQGTQLSIYRLKSPGILSKDRTPIPGRLLKSFTLQHSEVGVASDFKKSALTPKSPFAHLVPVAARQKLFETDPHLFEPVREHAFRLRLETEQFLLCANTQEDMLSWVENLCAAIDISPPLEDRSEPRYRSLPRRSRRQRVLDAPQLGETLEHLTDMELGRRLIAEQEAIIRELYPHLANANGAAPAPAHPAPSSDPDRDEFDPDDVRFPSRATASLSRDMESNEERPMTGSSSSSDPKDAPPARPSRSQALRYRRRCAPVLLACSPRVSDVVFSDGKRLRINTKEHILVEYTSHPPRYDAHNFPKSKRAPKALNITRNTTDSAPAKNAPPTVEVRPSSPFRGVSDDSINFGYDLASTSSEQDSDNVRSAASSQPPSPTAATQAKADAARQLTSMGKRRGSEEGGNHGLNSVALGVGLLI